MIVNHTAADPCFLLRVRMGGKGAGPGDVAMAGRVEGITSFVKDPTGAGINFTEGEVVGGDVRLAFREALFGVVELVHEGKSEVVLFAREVDLEETAGKLLGGFPA